MQRKTFLAGHQVGRALIVFETPYRETWSSAAQLISSVRTKLRAPTSSIKLLDQMSQSELDLHFRRILLNDLNVELVNKAMEHVTYYDSDLKLPDGFSVAGYVRLVNTNTVILRVEAAISNYLDGYYVVLERLRSCTAALNTESRNRIWPGIAELGDSKQGKRKVVLENLFKKFGASSKEASEFLCLVKYALKVRGEKTHALHLQAYLEERAGDEWPVVVFADKNPWQTELPRVRFDDRARGNWSQAIEELLKWWLDETKLQIEEL